MTITTLGEAAFPSPLASGDVPEFLVPADIQWPGGTVPDDLIDIIAAGGKRLDPDGELWRAVLSSTGQPAGFC